MFQLEFNDRIARILFDTFQAIYTLILTPISLYYAYEFWKLHKQRIQFIEKRRPQTVILVVLILNIYMIIIEPLVDLSNLHHFQTQLKPIHKYMFYIRAGLLHTIHFLLYTILYRLWLLYYDYIRSKQSLSMQWKIHLLHVDQYIPWTLRWKWMGKSNIIFIIVITLWLLSVAIMLAGIYVNRDYFGPIRILLTIPLLLGSIIISFKIRRCRDLFLIKREVMCIAFTVIITVILATIGVLFTSTLSNFRVIVRNCLSGICCYSVSFISTQWIIKQYKKELIKKQLIETSKHIQINKISFKLLLSTKDGFKTFANHLVKELSAEHLFFIYEMMTFKKDLIGAKILSEHNAEYMIPMNYMQNKRKLSKTTLNIHEINNKFLYIIEEYIISNGDYPINISSETRGNIMQIFHEIKAEMIPNDERPQLTMVQTTTNSFNTFNDNNHSNRVTPIPTPDKLHVINNEQNKFQLDGMEIIYEENNSNRVTPIGGDDGGEQAQFDVTDVKNDGGEKQIVFLNYNKENINIKVDNIQISGNNTPQTNIPISGNNTPNTTLDVMYQMEHTLTNTPNTPNIDIDIENNVMKINRYIEKFDIAIMEVSRLLRIQMYKHIKNIQTVAGEVEYIKNKSYYRFNRSEVGLNEEKKVSESRTCESAWLFGEQDIIVNSLKNRCQKILQIPKNHMEDMEVVRYKKGQRFDMHYDAFQQHDANSKQSQILLHGGFKNRIATILYYLSDIKFPKYEKNNFHGHTIFPKYDQNIQFDRNGVEKYNQSFGNTNNSLMIKCNTHNNNVNGGLKIKPQIGKTILFYNMLPNGELDTAGLHGGCRLKYGTKWAANQWIWNRPFNQ